MSVDLSFLKNLKEGIDFSEIETFIQDATEPGSFQGKIVAVHYYDNSDNKEKPCYKILIKIQVKGQNEQYADWSTINSEESLKIFLSHLKQLCEVTGANYTKLAKSSDMLEELASEMDDEFSGTKVKFNAERNKKGYLNIDYIK